MTHSNDDFASVLDKTHTSQEIVKKLNHREYQKVNGLYVYKTVCATS